MLPERLLNEKATMVSPNRRLRLGSNLNHMLAVFIVPYTINLFPNFGGGQFLWSSHWNATHYGRSPAWLPHFQ